MTQRIQRAVAAWRGALLCGLPALAASPAAADILFTSGAMAPIFAPVSLLDGATESSTLIGILDEGLKVLPTDIAVNAVGPGVHTYAAGPPLTITAGSLIHSYIVHFDPAGGVVALTGAVTFDPGEFIIGIMTHTPYLDASDAAAGHPMAIYPTGLLPFRAFETLPGTDTVTIAPGLGSASFSLIAELGIDQARIITSPAPAPSSLLALVVASAAMGARRRR